MEGSERDDLRRQLREREAEVSDLRRQLEQTQEENDRLRHENEELRKELKAAGRGSRHGKRKPKADPKGPGRKAGQGRFTFRRAPTSSEPPIEVPVTVGHCPCCGGELRYERTDEATVTDMPQAAQPSHGFSDSSPASQRRGPGTDSHRLCGSDGHRPGQELRCRGAIGRKAAEMLVSPQGEPQ